MQNKTLVFACVLFACLITVNSAVVPSPKLVCTDDICSLVRCAAVNPFECHGIVIPHGGFCGCCDACVKILHEGDNCALTELNGVPPTSMCAIGLSCEQVGNTDICVRHHH